MDEDETPTEVVEETPEVGALAAATSALDAASARITVLEDENRALALANAALKARNLELLSAIPVPDSSEDDADGEDIYEDVDGDPVDALFDKEDED